jgi:iron complex outermembrane receptor protein
LGLRDLGINRYFQNFPSLGGGDPGAAPGYADEYYTVNKTYTKALPSIGARYQLSEHQSTFFNVTENFKAPGNYDYFSLLTNNTGSTAINPPTVQPETSWDYDFGYRYAGQTFTFSGSVYFVDFKNRIDSYYNIAEQTNVDENVGTSHKYGLELESGYRLAQDWSLYGSLSYLQEKMQDNLIVKGTINNGKTVVDAILPTSGKQNADTPNWLAGMHVDYSHAEWNGFLEAKFTGRRYTTLVNDDSLGGYTLFNAGGSYKMPSSPVFKDPTIRFNILNLFNTHYLNLSSGSGSNYAKNTRPFIDPNGVSVAGNLDANGNPTSPYLYVGAPRAFNVTFSTTF